MIVAVVLLGWVTGVAINAVADSLPKSRRIQLPRCPACAAARPIAAWSAVVALLSGRRRCPSCSTPLPHRHLVVELGTALAFAGTWLRFEAPATRMLTLCYAAILILVAVTDLEHRLIQHAIMVPSIALALAGAFLNPAFDKPARALLGGAIGLVATLIIYWMGALFARVMGKMRGQPISEVAFGFGDVTLNTFIGLIVGAPEIIFSMVIGFLIGGLVATGVMVYQGLIKRKYAAFSAIPYGPFLIVGGATMLYWGKDFLAWYTNR